MSASKKQNRKTIRKTAGKVVIFIEAPAGLKEDMERLATEHNRSLTGECVTALQEWVRRHPSHNGKAE
jgi:hypothetical protein